MNQDHTDIYLALNNGTEVDHYRIIEKIGAGGMGEIYLADDTKLDRKIALKFLPASLVANQELKSRFVREAKAVAQLNHPNIAGIHEVGREDTVVYIICDFVNGVPLHDWMARRLTNREAVELCEKIARTLHYAHEKGVELARLQLLGELYDMLKIEIGVGVGPGVAPRAGVDGDRPHEGAEVQLSFLAHDNP